MTSAIPRLALRYAEAARRLGVSLATVKRRVGSGDIPIVDLSPRLHVVPASGLAMLLGIEPDDSGSDGLLSGPQVARALGVSPAAAHRLIAGGILPSVPWAGSRRVPLGHLQRWLAEHTDVGAPGGRP